MLKKIGVVFVVVSLLVICMSHAFAGNDTKKNSDWSLVWSDEFNGPQIDTSKWNFVEGGGGYGNNELECYTSRPENARIENGSLLITALKEDYQGNQYTSAKLTTQNKGDWTYGKYEIRAKLPKGKGMWPAIWMMPTDYNLYSGWPVCGEIDIMELLGHDPGTVYGTIHYGNPWTHTGAPYTLPGGASFADDYHIFSLEWAPGELKWYVDGVLYQTQNDWFSKNDNEAAEYTYPAPFDRNFYLQLNLAVGGNWPGNPDSTTQFPQSMAVDYVRVYKYNGTYPPAGPRPGPVVNDVPPVRPAQPDGNYVYNGTFDQDLVGVDGIPGTANSDYWQFLTLPDFGGTATATNDNGTMRIDISKPGTQTYSVQLVQPTIYQKTGQTYRVSFDAKSTAARNIMVKVSQVGGSWTAYSGEKTIGITQDMKHYYFEYTMAAPTDAQARLEFDVGLNSNPVYIDNVRLDAIDKQAADKTPLPNGNYIYNGTFDQGTDRTAFWELATKDNAKASMSVGEAVPDRILDVAIGTHKDKDEGNRYGVDHNNIGTSPDSIQLRQGHLNIEKGETYIVSFDAKAFAPRTIEVNAGSSADIPVSYSNPQVINITDTMSSYTFEFTMGADSDKNARLEFNLGTDKNDVFLDNIKMIKKAKPLPPPPPPPAGNDIITNGAFDNGTDGWGLWFADWEGANSQMAVENGVLKASVSYEGNETWATQVFQNNLNIENGQTYTVSFDAKSSVPRDIQVIVEHNGGDYTKYLGPQTVSLTQNMGTYTFEFTMLQPTDPATHLVFALGKIGDTNVGVPHDVYIDNVHIIKKAVTPPPAAVEIIQNGSFDNGTDSWGLWFADWEGAYSQMAVENGVLKASISYEGNETWATQVFQNNLNIENGQTYKVSFDAKSSVPRDIQVIVEHNGGDYTKYLGPQTVSLTQDMSTYTFEFTMTQPTDPATHLVFALGKIGDANVGALHDVYIDNVSVAAQ